MDLVPEGLRTAEVIQEQRELAKAEADAEERARLQRAQERLDILEFPKIGVAQRLVREWPVKRIGDTGIHEVFECSAP